MGIDFFCLYLSLHAHVECRRLSLSATQPANRNTMRDRQQSPNQTLGTCQTSKILDWLHVNLFLKGSCEKTDYSPHCISSVSTCSQVSAKYDRRLIISQTEGDGTASNICDPLKGHRFALSTAVVLDGLLGWRRLSALIITNLPKCGIDSWG